MPTTLSNITVPYTLLNHPSENGSFRGRVTDSGREDTASFLIDFADLDTFINEVKGSPVVYGADTTATITRNEPLQCPWNKRLYAIGLDYQSVGSDEVVSPARPWAEVMVTITFGALKWFPSDPSQPYLIRRYRSAGRVITVPGTAYTFSNGERREQDIGKRVGAHVIEITRLQLPSLDAFLAVAEPLEGCINSDVITLGKRVYPAGYLLFETFSAEIQLNGLGSPQATASMSLHYSALAWNSDVRSDGVIDTLTPLIYTASALSVLFS